MGLIAEAGTLQALQLFRDVVLALASVPLAVQPVFIEVDVDGRRYDEVHVDGAVGVHVFCNGGLFQTSVMRQRAIDHNTYEDACVIHNGQRSSQAEHTDRNLRSIAMRALRARVRAGRPGRRAASASWVASGSRACDWRP